MANKTVRFGFVTSRDTAKKLYAVLAHRREENVRETLTSTLEAIINTAYAGLPDGKQDLSAITLPEKKEAF